MCDHAVTFDHYDFWEPGTAAVTRQCLTCMHHWKVIGVDREEPLPSREQVLRDIAGWKMARLARERASLVTW